MGNRNSNMAHCLTGKRSRAFPCPTHETKTSSWLPPVESWDSGCIGLPYGWEAAFDREGKTYFINHVNKTTTCEDPRKDSDEEPPQARDVELIRDPQKGFGFVAGSEKPVIVRFVTEAGPSEGKLLPGDQILQINGEDVMKSPRERVIELVRSCKHSVKLQVCQPYANNTTRKSALLTAAKKAKLKSNPSRVRFAEGVVINGSPLYCPSPYDSTVPFMPNVLKVFLENGQTKSFKYDSTTTVQDVLNVLQGKLSLTAMDNFSLVVEHIRSIRRNKLSILNPKDTLAKIAARPGAHNLRCLFRITYVPKDIYEFMQRDPIAFDYLFVQSCNDVVQERFAPELKYDVALRLAALHLQQHAITTGIQGKMIVKTIEREYGLEKFVPVSLLETMKRKELLKLLNQLMKQNQTLSGPGQKQLTLLQTKFHYLKIVSDLPSYGAKSFATCTKNSALESAVLIGPRIGISQISTIRNIAPMNLAQFGELESVEVSREEEDDFIFQIKIRLRHMEKECLHFCMEDREADEFILVLEQYYRQIVGEELPVDWEGRNPEPVEIVPAYHGRHTVQEAPWSYCPPASESAEQQGATLPRVRAIDLSIPPPPYIPCEERQLSRSNSRDQFSIATSPSSVDYNMNEMEALVAALTTKIGNGGINFPIRNSTKEDSEPYTNDIPKIPETGEKTFPTLQDYASKSEFIASHLRKQEEVPSSNGMPAEKDSNKEDLKHYDAITRISEMSKIVNDAEMYLKSDAPAGNDLGSKSHDSLLFMQRNESDQFGEAVTPSSDLMPSESEAESTPTNSPTHHCPPSITESPRTMARKMCSSFGLHSPHLLAALDQQTDDVEELLRQLQASTDLPLEESSLCLDPDIIDLTVVPPPSATDVDFSLVTPDGVDIPSKSFMSTFEYQSDVNNQDTSTATNASVTENSEQYYSSQPGIPFSNSCCDTMSFATSSSSSSAPSSTSGYESCGMSGSEITPTEEDDDISAYIIPPPPISSSAVAEEQNRILARFRQAAEEVRRMMSQPHDNASCDKYADSINSVSKFCTIPRRHDETHRPSLSSLASLVTPIRESKCIASGSSSSFGSSNDGGQSDSCDNCFDGNKSGNKDSYLNGVNGDTGEPHPQPPPRTKRANSGPVENSETSLGSTGYTATTNSVTNGDFADTNGHAGSDAGTQQFTGSCSLDSFQVDRNHTPSQRISRPGENSLPLCVDHELQPVNQPNSEPYPVVNGHYNGQDAAMDLEYVSNGVSSKMSDSYVDHGLTFSDNNGQFEVLNKPFPLSGETVFKSCPSCSTTKNGFASCSMCGKFSRFRSYHQSLPRKAIHAGLKAYPMTVTNGEVVGNGYGEDNVSSVFKDARHDIAELVINLDTTCQSRLKACLEDQNIASDPVKLAKVRETLMSESRQFVTASKLFVKSITESSGKMEENLMMCLTLLDRIFAISEQVVLEMNKPSQINILVEKLKEMAIAYSRTVCAAHSAASGAIPNSNMAGLMHQATSLATSLTTLMRTLRTFHTP